MPACYATFTNLSPTFNTDASIKQIHSGLKLKTFLLRVAEGKLSAPRGE